VRTTEGLGQDSGNTSGNQYFSLGTGFW